MYTDSHDILSTYLDEGAPRVPRCLRYCSPELERVRRTVGSAHMEWRIVPLLLFRSKQQRQVSKPLQKSAELMPRISLTSGWYGLISEAPPSISREVQRDRGGAGIVNEPLERDRCHTANGASAVMSPLPLYDVGLSKLPGRPTDSAPKNRVCGMRAPAHAYASERANLLSNRAVRPPAGW